MADDERDPPPLREDQEELYKTSDDEAAAVARLREALQAVPATRDERPAPSDFTLVRFLRARKLDVEAACAMYAKSVEWRRANHVDALTQREVPYKELLARLVSNAHHKWDRHGRPIYMERTGLIHTAEFARLIPDEIVVKTHIHMMETCTDRMREWHERTGRPSHKLVTIQSMKGWNLGHRKLTHLFQLVSGIDQDYYPERLGALYMINSPWMFRGVWATVKYLVDEKTRRKIHILGDDLTEMVEDLGAECLPVEWGGTCECDGGCLLPVVSRADLKQMDLPSLVSDEDRAEPPLTERKLAARERFSLELRHDGPGGATFAWYFRTAKKDVSFAAVWRPDGDDAAEVAVAEERRVDAHLLPQSDRHAADGPGTLVLTWGNDYSRWSGKALSYHTSVVAAAAGGAEEGAAGDEAAE